MITQRRLILSESLFRIIGRNNWKKVGTVADKWFVALDNLLNKRFYANSEALSRLMADITKHSSAYILLFQIGNVYKSHSTGAITENKHVARKGKRSRMC